MTHAVQEDGHKTDKEAAAAIIQETVTAYPLPLAIGDEDTGEVRRLCHGSKGKRPALRQRQVAKRQLAREPRFLQ